MPRKLHLSELYREEARRDRWFDDMTKDKKKEHDKLVSRVQQAATEFSDRRSLKKKKEKKTARINMLRQKNHSDPEIQDLVAYGNTLRTEIEKSLEITQQRFLLSLKNWKTVFIGDMRESRAWAHTERGTKWRNYLEIVDQKINKYLSDLDITVSVDVEEQPLILPCSVDVYDEYENDEQPLKLPCGHNVVRKRVRWGVPRRNELPPCSEYTFVLQRYRPCPAVIPVAVYPVRFSTNLVRTWVACMLPHNFFGGCMSIKIQFHGVS